MFRCTGTNSNYDLMSVYNGGKHVSMAGLLVGYGLFGDVIKYAEENRWMGRFRYVPASESQITSRNT